MPEGPVNYLAVLVAAASSMAIGFAWYGAFGKAWMAAMGISEAHARGGNPAILYGGAFVLALVQCYCLARFIGPVDWQSATFYGFLTGFGWVATALGVQYLFERKPLNAFLINGGYNVVTFTVFGLILGLWK